MPLYGSWRGMVFIGHRQLLSQSLHYVWLNMLWRLDGEGHVVVVWIITDLVEGASVITLPIDVGRHACWRILRIGDVLIIDVNVDLTRGPFPTGLWR